MGQGYPNLSGTRMKFNFSSPLSMDRVMGKYMRIGYGDGEVQTRLHPASLSCLGVLQDPSFCTTCNIPLVNSVSYQCRLSASENDCLSYDISVISNHLYICNISSLHSFSRFFSTQSEAYSFILSLLSRFSLPLDSESLIHHPNSNQFNM